VIEVETDLALGGTNLRVGLGRGPEAEVINTVNDGGLAERILSGSLLLGGRKVKIGTMMREENEDSRSSCRCCSLIVCHVRQCQCRPGRARKGKKVR
jgi:hypothetical protein